VTATTGPAEVPLTVSGEYLPDFVQPVPPVQPQRIAYVPNDNDRGLIVPMEII
jgi:hypothetical protein